LQRAPHNSKVKLSRKNKVQEPPGEFDLAMKRLHPNERIKGLMVGRPASKSKGQR